jgi:hypothetical protein
VNVGAQLMPSPPVTEFDLFDIILLSHSIL